MHMRNIVGTILVATTLLCCCGCTFFSDSSEARSSEYSKADVVVYLSEAGLEFYESITVIEHEGENGTYYTGEISAELDAVLEKLVDAYNADPTTTAPVTIEQIRYDLTEGLSEATKEDQWNSPFMQFMRWNAAPADLVYTYDVPEAGIKAGDDYLGESISNYEYAIDKENFPLYALK